MPGHQVRGTTRNQFLTLSENHVFSPTVLNSARGSFSSVRLQSGIRHDRDLSGPQYTMIPGYPIGAFGITGIHWIWRSEHRWVRPTSGRCTASCRSATI